MGIHLQEIHGLHDEFRRRFEESQPDRPGVTGKLQQVILDGPEGDVAYYWIIEDGRMLEAAVGELEDAEVTMSASWEVSTAVQKGELDANAAFMQGKMKVNGNMAKLMKLMPITASPEYRALMTEMTEVTEF